NEIVIRVGRYGPYLQRGDDRASIPEDLPPDELTLEKASELLSAPSGDRVLGADAEGTPVIARAGRYGPYVQLGDTNGDANAQPKRRRGQRAAAAPLKELGADPSSGKPIVLREGRFGPYVTDGETNASLQKDDSIDAITPDRAAELLRDRRARGPAKPRARRTGAKKPAKRKPKASG